MISKDPDMFHKGTNTATNVQSSNLNEELGQIEYVFSDKTGTLTQNNMEFRKLVARGKPYGKNFLFVEFWVLIVIRSGPECEGH